MVVHGTKHCVTLYDTFMGFPLKYFAASGQNSFSIQDLERVRRCTKQNWFCTSV